LKPIFLSIFLFVVTLTSPVLGGDLRIATVDMARLFTAYPGTKAAQTRFEAVARERESQLMEEEKDLQAQHGQFLNSRKGMSESKRKASEEALTKKIEAFAEKKETYLSEMKSKEEDMSRDLVAEIQAVIDSVARDRKVDLVLDKAKVVYVKDAMDLTPEVLKRFEKSEKKVAP